MRFCDLWNEVRDAPPTVDRPVFVTDEMVATAEQTDTIGQECTDPNAMVDLDGAMLARGESVTDLPDDPAEGSFASVTSPGVTAGAKVLDNVSISALSADIRPNGIRLTGNVAVQLDGVRSTIGFVGALTDLRNWSVSLSSTSLTIPGISSSPVVFSGTLRVVDDVPSLSLTARATEAQVGDVHVGAAEIHLQASPATGVSATVTGDISVGPNSIDGTLDVAFDPAGALLSANAALAVQLSGRQADGTQIELDGTVHLDGNADETVMTLDASGRIDDLIVQAAAGTLHVEDDVATFEGVLDIREGTDRARFNAGITFDGISAELDYLRAEAVGEISGKMADGTLVSAKGSLETVVVGGQSRTAIRGEFRIGSLTATGSALLEIRGVSTTLTMLDVDLTSPRLTGHLDGRVIITAGDADLVELDVDLETLDIDGVEVTDAELRIRTASGRLDFSLFGDLAIATDTATGEMHVDLSATVGPEGGLLDVRGEVELPSLTVNSIRIEGLRGSLAATAGHLNLTVSGGVVLNPKISMSVKGSMAIVDGDPTWEFLGGGRLNVADIIIIDVDNITLTPLVGLRTLRVELRHHFWFHRYLEFDLTLPPDGSCLIDVRQGTPIVREIVRNRIPGATGCTVDA